MSLLDMFDSPDILASILGSNGVTPSSNAMDSGAMNANTAVSLMPQQQGAPAPSFSYAPSNVAPTMGVGGAPPPPPPPNAMPPTGSTYGGLSAALGLPQGKSLLDMVDDPDFLGSILGVGSNNGAANSPAAASMGAQPQGAFNGTAAPPPGPNLGPNAGTGVPGSAPPPTQGSPSPSPAAPTPSATAPSPYDGLMRALAPNQGGNWGSAIATGLAGLGKGLSAVGSLPFGANGTQAFAAGAGGALSGGAAFQQQQQRNNIASIGPMSELYKLRLMQQQYGFDQSSGALLGGQQLSTSATSPTPDYPQRVAQAESGGNPNAAASTSSAEGLYQFTQPTWNNLVAQNPSAGLTSDGRMDPTQENIAFGLVTNENARYLQAHGVAPSNTNLYAAHVFGAPSAVGFIQNASQQPNAPATSQVDAAAVKANPNLFYDANGQPVSGADLYSNLSSKMGGSQGSLVQSAIQTDPTLGGLVPQNYPGGPQAYLSALYQRAADPRSGAGAKEALQLRIKGIQDFIGKAGALPDDAKNWMLDRNPGETMADYQARVAGGKEAAIAPYQIAEAAVREGGRPVTVAPNAVVTTGAQVNPALNNITNWATNRLGIPNAGQPPAPAQAPAPVAPSTQSLPGAMSPQMPSAQPAVPGMPTPTPPASPPLASPAPQNAMGQGGPNATPANGSALPNNSGLPFGQSPFSPRLIRNPDGSVASSVTPATEAIQHDQAADFDKAHDAYNAAQPVQQQLATLESSFRDLNQAGWSTMGSGANARIELAKAVNSVWQVAGVQGQDLPFDPDKIASWETATKESTRLGFSLARTLGAREAMQVVQGAIRANPNVENTPLGAQMVLNTIRNNAQRDTDRYQFLTNYMQTHGGDLTNADVQFNQMNPPALYARRAIVQAQKNIPQEAIDALRQNPSLAPDFDKHYGSNGMAQFFIGNSMPPGNAQ